MSIVIIKPGLLDTIQDEGRYGFQHLGINPNGCMDIIASGIVNTLVGNKTNEAVIEFHFPASTILFNCNCLIALSGGDFGATVNNVPIPINTSIVVYKNSVLKFIHYNTGSRCYLAVHGGLQVERWLNSYSTNLKAKAGGYEGRSLRKDDVINVAKANINIDNTRGNMVEVLPIKINASEFYTKENVIRCIPGSEHGWLSEDSKKLFESSLYNITIQSDRMGYRLQGPSLQVINNLPLLSSGVTRGTIQLLPNGQLIVLMADHQTTGGYPKIANVLSADIPRLAQCKLKESIQFRLIEHGEAESLCYEQQKRLQFLQNEIQSQLKEFLEENSFGSFIDT